MWNGHFEGEWNHGSKVSDIRVLVPNLRIGNGIVIEAPASGRVETLVAPI